MSKKIVTSTQNSFCNIDNSDIKNANSIIQDIQTRVMQEQDLDAITGDATQENVAQLIDITNKYDYPTYKCLLNQYHPLNKQYLDFCSNPQKKEQLTMYLNVIEHIIDTYGNDAEIILEKYLNMLESFEQDCYVRTSTPLSSQIKRILKKLGKVLSYNLNDETMNFSESEGVMISKNFNDVQEPMIKKHSKGIIISLSTVIGILIIIVIILIIKNRK